MEKSYNHPIILVCQANKKLAFMDTRLLTLAANVLGTVGENCVVGESTVIQRIVVELAVSLGNPT